MARITTTHRGVTYSIDRVASVSRNGVSVAVSVNGQFLTKARLSIEIETNGVALGDTDKDHCTIATQLLYRLLAKGLHS